MKKFTILTTAILAASILLPATSQAESGQTYVSNGVFRQGVSMNGTDGFTPPNATHSSERAVAAVTLPNGSVVQTGLGLNLQELHLSDSAHSQTLQR